MSGMGASCDEKDGSSAGIFWDEPRENNAGDVIGSSVLPKGIAQGSGGGGGGGGGGHSKL